MASVRKIENKKGISYKIEVSNGYDRSGKKIRATTTFIPDSAMTKKQQERALQKFAMEFEEKVKNGNCISGDKMTLEELTGEWLKTYADNHLERSTYSRYIKIINQIILPALGHLKLNKIKPYQVESFYVSLTKDGARKDGKEGGYAYGTIRKVSTVLSSILSSAEQWEIIESNPCQKAKLPKHEEEEKLVYFTVEQTKKFLQFVEDDYTKTKERHSRQKHNIVSIQDYVTADVLKLQYKVLFQIALFGGLRRGELVGLVWENVDFNNCNIIIKQTANRVEGENIVKCPKTQSSIRTVTLPEPVMDLLKEYQQEQNKYRRSLGNQWNGADWLFIQADGRIMSIGSPYAKFHSLIKKYNETVPQEEQLPIIPLHGLRHTNASILVQSNKVDMKTVSNKLGHSKIATTMNYYVHSYEETEKETAHVLEDILLEKRSTVAK